ncbi:MAG: NAD(+) synthase, partial [Bacteroidota bacterium]
AHRSMRTLKIGGAPLNQTPLDWENNLGNILEAIRRAKGEGVQLICLPELAITGYGCEDVFLSEWLPTKALEEYLPQVIEASEGIAVAVGLPLRFEGALYNTQCFIHDRKILGFSAKQFLANEGVHYEPRWFTPWRADHMAQFEYQGHLYPLGDIIYEFEGIKIAFEICEDAWKPDDVRPACRYLPKGIDLIMNSSASHFAFGKGGDREQLFVGSSKTFDCAYLFTNLLGNEAGKMIYDGEVIIAQKGKLLARNQHLSFDQMNLLTAELNFDDPSASTGESIAPLLSKEEQFPQAAGLGLYDYMRKTYSKGYVLSLSGGADSSSCAILVAEMVRRGVAELGIEGFLEKTVFATRAQELSGMSQAEALKTITQWMLTTAYQGTVNSSQDTLDSAQHLADSIGATFYNWRVDEPIDAYREKIETALGRELTWEQDDIALQNIQARGRAPIIWMLTNLSGGLLLTTSNRSEGDVGYATMDGDTSGSLAPIAGVDKQFILDWLQWAEKDLGYTGLAKVNSLQPSAELRPQERVQRDEDDLMPYTIIAAIEQEAVGQRKSPLQVYESLVVQNLEPAELLKAHIVKFFRLWSRNQWKRERLAPSFHLDGFSVDPRSWYRFPILSGGFGRELHELENK